MSLPQNDTSTISSRESNEDRPQEQTTRCAVLTGTGRSAIAVVEVWGPRAAECIETLFHAASGGPMRRGQIRFGVWIGHQQFGQDIATDPTNSTAKASCPGESIVVVPFTSERYEIHCHGGKAAIGRIVADLYDLGVQEGQPPTSSLFSTTHLASGDRLIDEACEVLSTCTTRMTAAIVLDQVRGALKRWRDESIELISKAADQDTSRSAEIARQAAQIATSGRLGVRLAKPLEVVLAGPPNVGKSSLINAIVGYDRSITMDLPGTTRDVLDAETVVEGWPLRLRDTAGLHSSDHLIERQGIQRALAAIESADLVVQVGQPGVHLADQVFTRMIGRLDPEIPVLHVLNKSDLESHDESMDSAAPIKTIATTGQGVPELIGEITREIRAQVPESGSPVPVTRRQLNWVHRIAALADDPQAMSEVLREK